MLNYIVNNQCFKVTGSDDNLVLSTLRNNRIIQIIKLRLSHTNGWLTATIGNHGKLINTSDGARIQPYQVVALAVCLKLLDRTIYIAKFARQFLRVNDDFVVTVTTPNILCATRQRHSAASTTGLEAVEVNVSEGVRVVGTVIWCAWKYACREIERYCVNILVRCINNICSSSISKDLCTPKCIYVGYAIDGLRQTSIMAEYRYTNVRWYPCIGFAIGRPEENVLVQIMLVVFYTIFSSPHEPQNHVVWRVKATI